MIRVSNGPWIAMEVIRIGSSKSYIKDAGALKLYLFKFWQCDDLN